MIFGALAAGVGMSLAGSLFKGKSQNQTTTVQQPLSPHEQRYWEFISNRATNLAQQPYQPYTGQRVAPINTTQQAAKDQAISSARRWEQPFDEAQNLSRSSASAFGPGSLDPFMSPYTSGVVDEIGRLGDERFSGVGGLQEQLGDVFTGHGQFASDRHGRVLADAATKNQRETLGQQRMALQAGHEQAMQGYNAQKSRELAGAGALSALAGQRAGLERGVTDDLLRFGSMEQAQRQRELDVPYQDFIEQRDWDMDRLQQASSAASGMSGARTSITNAPVAQPHPLQHFLSGVGLYTGLNREFGPFQWPSTSAPASSGWPYNAGEWPIGGAPYKRGGAVKKYRKGGIVVKRKGGLARLAA